jgi:hypothetical protein
MQREGVTAPIASATSREQLASLGTRCSCTSRPTTWGARRGERLSERLSA